MADTDQVSVAARSLAAQRWGASRPIRLAQELAERAQELPEPQRRLLLEALTRRAVEGQPREFGGSGVNVPE